MLRTIKVTSNLWSNHKSINKIWYHFRILQIINPTQEGYTILRGVEYIWRKEGINGEIIEEGGSKDIGVIAQEVKEILPELIGGTEKHGYKVSYDEMISVLFEAIKEQELILDVKESELTELENKFKRNQ